ncbi:hypothetical protein PC120_g19211 [Phytophthora cactorum]|nr:hypothetical protein PC120_g19211 [Phytophthora cactorum]
MEKDACVEEDFEQKQSARVGDTLPSLERLVENFNKDAKAHRARITAAHSASRPSQRFEAFSRRHMIDCLHNEAMEPERLSERVLTGYTTVRIPAQLRDLRAQLERRDERRDTPSVSGDRRARAGITPALRSGLRTPSPFPERLPSGHSAVPMCLGEEEMLSNEYEDEPDLGSSSAVHSPRFAQLSTESSASRSGGGGGGRYPGVTFQSVELRYQKAQVAQAAQTASNIQVELGTQLQDRVAVLEKLAYAASSSSANHQG